MASLPIVGLTLGTKPGAARVFTVILNNMIFEPTPADLRVGDTVSDATAATFSVDN